MLSHVRINKMSKVLHDLGFEENRIVGSHIRFYNPSFNALILLPIIYGELGLGHLRMIEKTLEEKGVLSREEFESRLNGKSGKNLLNHVKPLRRQKQAAA